MSERGDPPQLRQAQDAGPLPDPYRRHKEDGADRVLFEQRECILVIGDVAVVKSHAWRNHHRPRSGLELSHQLQMLLQLARSYAIEIARLGWHDFVVGQDAAARILRTADPRVARRFSLAQLFGRGPEIR